MFRVALLIAAIGSVYLLPECPGVSLPFESLVFDCKHVKS